MMKKCSHAVLIVLIAMISGSVYAGFDTESCAAIADLAFASAKARDRGVTMKQALDGTEQAGRKHGMSEQEIKLVIETKLLAYRNPNQSPSQIRAFAFNACTQSK